MADFFPRSRDLPAQSPLFWVTHKDRYLRQLLISDIQEDTKRDLVVYFTDCDRTTAVIDSGDDVYIAELLRACAGKPVDLLIETNGGVTDATEKICALLRQNINDLRVIVPRKAKSNGTVIALCGSSIMMGPESELGPIDPSINGIPVEFVLNAPSGFTPLDIQIANSAREQTRKLAKYLLSTGMMSRQIKDIDDVIEKIATRNHYPSHGSVIDTKEAKELGLSVTEHLITDPLWQKIWLLRTMYQYDCGVNGYAKIFESTKVSAAVSLRPLPPAPKAP
ncbi:MAG: hypothetical protein WCB36_03550 [Burkholderiales bacterium]